MSRDDMLKQLKLLPGHCAMKEGDNYFIYPVRWAINDLPYTFRSSDDATFWVAKQK